MKRLLLLIFITISPFISAQDFVVYRLSGDVQLRRAGSTKWKAASQKNTLNSRDYLMVSSGGYVRIIDKRDNSIYRIESTKAAKVGDLVLAAKKQSENITARLNEELLADLKDQHAKPDYSVIGGSSRGETASESFLRQLASSLLSHPAGNALLTYEMIPEDEGCIHFRVRNNTETPLYVNILNRNHARNSLCFVTSIPNNSCILIPQGESLELKAYSFLIGDSLFTVFGTIMPVDSRALQRVLDNSEAVSSIPEGAVIGVRM